jgi:hypothetical protein
MRVRHRLEVMHACVPSCGSCAVCTENKLSVCVRDYQNDAVECGEMTLYMYWEY